MKHRELTAKQLAAARIGLLTAAVLMIAFGVFRGEPDSVIQKAVRICLECIGIG